MAIKPFQNNIALIGHFDIKDTDLSDLKGGEVLVFEAKDTNLSDNASADIFQQTNRSFLRKATDADTGPFFLAGHESDTVFSNPGFEISNAFSTNRAFAQRPDSSGKVSIYAAEGFYSLNSDVVDTITINATTPVYSELYVDGYWHITRTPGSAASLLGFFIEWQSGDTIRGYPHNFTYLSEHKSGDSIIIYKTVGNLGTLGATTDGYFTDGYFNLTPETTIADAVDLLNQGFESISTGTVSTALGVPSDGTYLDGFFPFTSSTLVSNAIDDINELLFSIAPAKPGLLTGNILTLSGTTLFDAKLPSGLSAAWYTGGESPGDTITTYITDGTYTLNSPSQTSSFNGGVLSDPSQLGTITHILNGIDGYTYDVATNLTGTIDTITVSDISVYNTIWNKINANINIIQVADGRETHAIKHTISGTSDTSALFLDTVNTNPTFSIAPSFIENTPVDGYLSGIVYYYANSTFDVSYTAASGIFNRAYHPTEVSRIELVGSPNTSINPLVVPAFGDTFTVTNQTITLSISNIASESPNIIVRLFKPNGATVSSSSPLSRSINTFGVSSTSTLELFVDEAKRLSGLASSAPDFNSNALLTDGYAQVYISSSNGKLSFPRAADYPAFSATEQFYERHFLKSSASSGSILFGGFTIASIDSYGTGDTNILLRLDIDNLWFDCAKPVGSNNGNGSGDSPANSIGCQVGTSTGSTLDFSFGTNSTATNLNQYRMQIIFRNTNDSITSITTS